MEIYEAPDAQQFDSRIDKLYAHASQRMEVLRAFSGIENVFDAHVQTVVIPQKFNDLKKYDCAQILDEKLKQLSYWLCKFAMSEPDDAEWHLRAETCLFVLQNAEVQKSKLQQHIIVLTEQNKHEYFPSHLLHHLPPITSKTRILTDFELMCPLLATRKYQVLNRKLIFEDSPEFLTNLKIALFMNIYDKSSDNCVGFANDPELDADFKDLLKKIQSLKYGPVTIQSVQQSAKFGFQLQSLETLIRRGAVPLCGIRLIRQLQKNNKLKHSERLQLYTYLKDAGMSYDDAYQLIKRHFCESSKMTEDKFKKEYQYNIQHVYGLVGAKKGAHCSGCQALIQNVPGTGFAHGCPFRAMAMADIEELIASNIRGENISAAELVNAIKVPAEQKYYEQACQHLFQALFGVGTGGYSPQKYTQAALSLLGALPEQK